MYVPPAFREDRIEILHAAIREAGLATLVSLGTDGLVASHVPMLLDPEAGPNGTLYGHLAKANPHAAGGVAGVEALARALRAATAIDSRRPDAVPSTKGTLGGSL